MEAGLKEKLKNKIISSMDMSKDIRDEDIGSIIDQCILEETKNYYVPVKEKVRLRIELFNSVRRLDVLTEFMEDDSVSEIMVNGLDSIFVECDGKLIKTNKRFESEERLYTVIQQIVSECNRRINGADPIVDARLSDGSRVNIVIPPVSLNKAVITIRKFPKDEINMKRLIELDSLSEDVAQVLRLLVEAKYNIFISGGTGSGKTTFLNALSDFIPKDERIITIEDSAELRLQGIENLVRLETRTSNVEGKNEITIRDLIKTSLRMRPDRIIVGEVRDEAVIDMLTAMVSGHSGSISTGHSNSAIDMLGRLETMYLMGMNIPLYAVKKQISQGIDIIIHLGRLRDKSRKVISISEVNGMKEGEICLNTLFEFVEKEEQKGKIIGTLRRVNDMLNIQKLKDMGLFPVYEELCVKSQYI